MPAEAAFSKKDARLAGPAKPLAVTEKFGSPISILSHPENPL
jgi:hypothetical protein